MKLPVRMSVNDPDCDFDLASRLVIKLDGVVQDKVVSFDTEKGMIERFATDDQGELVVFLGNVDLEVLFGQVTVHLKDDDAPHERCGRNHPLPG